MESIVLSIVSSYLKEYVNNFRREQISVNFLQGQGIIRDLDINVEPFNEMIFSSGAPAFKFLRIVLNSLSIHAPFMSLKSQPIVVYIDEMFVEIVETEDIVPKDKKAKEKSKATGGSKYGFSDRVIDSIAFEINKIYISVRTLGRFKTTQSHRGSPPIILLELSNNRFACTNHNGVEADLDECIRVRLTKRPMLFIYKRLISKNASVYLVNPMIWYKLSKAIRVNIGSKKTLSSLITTYKLQPDDRPYVISTIINDTSFQVNLCFRKRVENSLLLGLEVCFRFPEKTRMTLKQFILGEFINCIYGVQSAMSRRDAVEEIYGPNPHNEPGITKYLASLQKSSSSASPFSPDRQSSTSSSGGGFASFFGSRSRSKSSDSEENKQIFVRNKLSKDEIRRLTTIEAEIEKDATSAADKLDSESITSDEWDNDIDPPHMRFVLAFEVHDIIATFSYNEVAVHQDDKFTMSDEQLSFSSSKVGSSPRNTSKKGEHGAGSEPRSPEERSRRNNNSNSNSKLNNNVIRGVDLHLTNLVFSSIWKESASKTESVSQVSFKTIHLTEFIGTSKNCMMRSTTPIDHKGTNYLKLVPRGIKEYSNFDPETYIGTSFLFRDDSNWPSPPVNMGFGSKIDCVVGAFEFTFNFDSINKFLKFLKGAYDRPMNLYAKGPDESMHTPVSKQISMMVYGFKCFLYSDFVDDNKSSGMPYSKTLIPSHVVFEIGLSSIAWKPTLDLKAFLRAVGENTRTAPHTPTDLTNTLKAFKPVHEVNLLSDRFEASVSQICLKFADLNSKSGDSKGDSYRSLIKPFSIHYMISVDPHPEKDLILPSAESFFNPYNRVFYWAKGTTTIVSHLISIDNIVVYCSLLDITRIININFLIYEWMQEYYVNGIFDMNDTEQRVEYDPANIILIVKVMNIQFNLLQPDISQTSKSLPTLSKPQSSIQSSTTTAINAPKDDSLANDRIKKLSVDQKLMNVYQSVDMQFEIAFVTTVFEWIDCEPTWSSESLIVKVLIGSICHYVNESPAYFITQASTKECFDMCWSNTSNRSKIMTGSPVIVMRYEAMIDKSITTSLASSKDVDDFPVHEFTVGQCTIDICKNVNIVGVTQPFEHLLETMIDQLLHGHGIIYSATGSTFDNCILGYWMNLANYFYHVNFIQHSPKLQKNDIKSDSSANLTKYTATSLNMSDSNTSATTTSSSINASVAGSAISVGRDSSVVIDFEQSIPTSSSYLYRDTLAPFQEHLPNHSNINSRETEAYSKFNEIEETYTVEVDDIDSNSFVETTNNAPKKYHKILEFILRSENIDFGLVDPLERDGKYVALGVAVDSGFINGCFSPTLPQYFKSKMQSKQSLIFYHQHQKDYQTFERLVFTTPFSLNGELKRSADGQFQLGWNSSLQNMFLNLEKNYKSTATEIITRLAAQIQMSTNAVSSMLSAAKYRLDSEGGNINTSDLSNESKNQDVNNGADTTTTLDPVEAVRARALTSSEQPISFNNMASGEIVTMLLSKKKESLPIGVNKNDFTKSVNITTDLIDSIQKLTENVTQQLSSFHSKNLTQHLESRSSIETAGQLTHSQDSHCDRLGKVIAVTGTQTIIHCGFVKRSSSFSRSDRTVGSTRVWCIVNPTNMIFMSNPYSSKIDFEISFTSKNVEVYDPDEGKEVEGKVSLTSKLWIRNIALDGAVMVLDYNTFDEKVIWIEALRPWLNEATAQRMNAMKRRSILSLAFSSTSETLSSPLPGNSSGGSSSGTTTPDSNSGGSGEGAFSGHSDVSDSGGNRKGRFKSAAMSMMSTLSLSKKKDKVDVKPTENSLKTPEKLMSSATEENENKLIESTGDEIPETPFEDSETAKAFPHFVKCMIRDTREIQEFSSKLSKRFTEVLEKVDANNASEQINYNKSHNLLTSLMISLIGLDNSVRDISKSSLDFHDENLAIIASLSKDLQASISQCDTTTRQCKRYLQRKEECDSLLEAITMQHINTTMEMSKRYDDLMEYYNDLRYKDTSGIIGNSVNIHESVKNLRTSLHEVEKMLASSVESEMMLKEDIISTRYELLLLKESLPIVTERFDKSLQKINDDQDALNIEYANLMEKKQVVQAERDSYKEKYELLLKRFEEKQNQSH